MSLRVGACAVLVLCLLRAAVGAQTPEIPGADPNPQPSPSPGPPGRFHFVPALAVSEVYDDNLFATVTAVEADTISRLEPSLELRYRDPRLSAEARGSIDAERYQDHPALNTALARREVSVSSQLELSAVTLAARGGYFRTLTAGELNLTTGIQPGRIEGSRLSSVESIAYRFGPRTSGAVEYEFSRDRLLDGLPTDTHSARIVLERLLGPRDTGGLGYRYQRFVFGAGAPINSHVATLGWQRDLTRNARLELRAGPRYTEGQLRPEVAASLRQRFERGEIVLGYVQTETTAIGQRGTLRAQGATASFLWRPSRWFEFATTPGVFRDRGEGQNTKVARVDSQLTLHAAHWLSIEGIHEFSFQQGSVPLPTLDAPLLLRSGDLRHNVFAVRLVAAEWERKRQREPGEAGGREK
jgi:hypothetical protein